MAWRDLRVAQRLGLRVPLLQSPMAGVQASALAIAVSYAGGLGAIPCALMSVDAVRAHVQNFRKATNAPLNLNFFCHTLPPGNATADKQWQDILRPYYQEYGIEMPDLAATKDALRMPFDDKSVQLVRELTPEVISFHFGLPCPRLLNSVKDTGAFIISSATTVREALWLEERGCDAVIAQGLEAGGHRGVFLSNTKEQNYSSNCQYRNSSMDFPQQTNTLSLVSQLVNAVNVPVIAAGGIGDARGILAAQRLGAAAVQMGTVFLLADEATTSTLHRNVLKRAANATENEIPETAITNIFSGRPARGFMTRVMQDLGPMCAAAPEFPTAGTLLENLRLAAEAKGETAFSPMWSGQSPNFAFEQSATTILRSIIQDLDERICSRV